jgi:hypothetical protein
MRQNYLLLLLLIIISFSCDCTRPDYSVISDREIEELHYLKEIQWPKAYRDQDTVLLNRILAEEFQFIQDDGSYSDKEAELDWIKNNAFAYDTFYFEIRSVNVFENGTAIVSGTGHILVDTAKVIYQSSNVLIRRDGRWQAISSHVSGVEEVD